MRAGGDTAFGYHYFFATAAGNSCYYSVIPVLDDTCLINTGCGGGGCSLSLSQTQEQERTQVTSHEFAEMTTDPAFPTGWFGPLSDENGDICNGEADSITVGANTWDVQRIYSKTDDIATNGASFCRATAPSPIPKLSPGPSAISAAMTSAQHSVTTKPSFRYPTPSMMRSRSKPLGTTRKSSVIPDASSILSTPIMCWVTCSNPSAVRRCA